MHAAYELQTNMMEWRLIKFFIYLFIYCYIYSFGALARCNGVLKGNDQHKNGRNIALLVIMKFK